jgi:hypothetical protein
MPHRFIIRDLLFLTLVVALATGWWLDHKRLADRRDLYIREEVARYQKAVEDSVNTQDGVLTIVGDLLHGMWGMRPCTMTGFLAATKHGSKQSASTL